MKHAKQHEVEADETPAPEPALETNEHGEVVLPDVARRIDYSEGGSGGWFHEQEKAGHPDQEGASDARVLILEREE